MKYYYYTYEKVDSHSRHIGEAIQSIDGFFSVSKAKDFIKEIYGFAPYITFIVEISEDEYDELDKRFSE